MSEQFFHMQGICKSYRLADEDVPVLRGIDLDIEPGEYLSVLGRLRKRRARLRP